MEPEDPRMVGSRSWFAPLHPSGRQWPLSLSIFVCLDGVAVRPLSRINSLWPHGLQHARLPCPSPSSRACSNSCPLSQQRHPTISSSVAPFSSCPQSFPASGSFLRIRWPRYWSFYLVLNICLLYSRPAHDGLLNGHGKEWNTLFLKARDAILKEFPRQLSGKESTCQCRRHRRHELDPWVGKILWRRAWQTTPVFLPGESHGQRSQVGYSPQGHKELDMTEQLCMFACHSKMICIDFTSCFQTRLT